MIAILFHSKSFFIRLNASAQIIAETERNILIRNKVIPKSYWKIMYVK